MPNVVLVVDMVIGFLEPGHNLYDEGYRNLIPSIQRLIETEQAQGSKVVFLCDNHDPDDLEFQMFPVHCVRGTDEPNVIGELAGYEGEVIPKRRYSAFFDTDLDERLAELEPDKVTVCGVCTDICVMHTVSDLRDRDYVVEVPEDCVATFNPEAHTFALEHMEKILGAKVLREAGAAAS